MKAYKKRIELLTKALKMCVDALDRLMGDTDVEGDDSTEFRAMQFACKVLDEIGEGNLDPLKPLSDEEAANFKPITKEQIDEALAEGKKAKDAFDKSIVGREMLKGNERNAAMEDLTPEIVYNGDCTPSIKKGEYLTSENISPYQHIIEDARRVFKQHEFTTIHGDGVKIAKSIERSIEHECHLQTRVDFIEPNLFKAYVSIERPDLLDANSLQMPAEWVEL